MALKAAAQETCPSTEFGSTKIAPAGSCAQPTVPDSLARAFLLLQLLALSPQWFVQAVPRAPEHVTASLGENAQRLADS